MLIRVPIKALLSRWRRFITLRSASTPLTELILGNPSGNTFLVPMYDDFFYECRLVKHLEGKRASARSSTTMLCACRNI